MNEATVEFIAILVTIAGLLGWLLKQVISYFIKSATEKSEYIEKLVSQNQENTTNFVNTINHQRTLDREMQDKHLTVIRELRDEMHVSNEVNSKVLGLLKEKS
jgi:hypothetical protein